MSVVYVAAMFMTIMDSTIVNVALPTIGRSFGVASTSVASVSIYFLVSLAVFMSASGWLGDRFGGKRVLLTAIVVFTVASALCGMAGSLAELDVFRVLQGAGGGMMAPVGLAMLFRAFPPAERLRASSILTVPTTLAPALGPVLGGLLVTELSWRWVFYVNVPLGILAIAFGALFLESGNALQPGPFDTVGFVLAGASLGLLMFCLGVAMGQVFVPAQAAAFATISPEATGHASTMFNVIRQLGSAVGVAVFTTVIVAAGTTKTAAGRPAADLAAYHAAFLVAAALAAVGAAVALTIHDADAASTMVRRGSRKTRQGGRVAAGLARQRPPGALARLPTARHVLARRPGRQPGEVPARERCVQRLGHELIKRRHTSSLAQTPCRTSKLPPPWSRPPPGEKMGLWQETQTTRRGSSLLPGRPLRPRWQSGGSRWRQRPLKRGASSIRPSAPRWRPGALRLPGTGVPVVAHAARPTPMTGACATAARS